MKVLLDTHFIIWAINSPAMILPRERGILNEAEAVYASAASLWELRIKWTAYDREGQRKGVLDPATALDFIDRSGWLPVSLDVTDSTVALEPRPTHRDPFDEMLLVHARQLSARLLTRDGKLRDHPLAVQP